MWLLAPAVARRVAMWLLGCSGMVARSVARVFWVVARRLR